MASMWLSWLYFPSYIHPRDEVFGENEHEMHTHTKKRDKEPGIEIPDPTYKHFGRVC